MPEGAVERQPGCDSLRLGKVRRGHGFLILARKTSTPKCCVPQTSYNSHGILSRTPVLTEEETCLTKVSDLAQFTEGLKGSDRI